jgi:hypothetical protein
MMWPPSKPVLDTIDEAVKVAAVLVGGGWTYLNYRRGRTFRTRLELDLKGSIGEQGGAQFFLGECQAKNVGLSKVPVKKIGTGVSVFALRLVPRKGGGHRVVEEEVDVRSLFAKHGWIEPGETISEPVLLALPPSATPLMGVRMAVMFSDGKTTWNASAVTDCTKPKPAAKEKHDDA